MSARPDLLGLLPFADVADPDPNTLPYVAQGHPDDEPERADVSNGDPCPTCGRQVYLERPWTGAPMRWVHRDDSPACPWVTS